MGILDRFYGGASKRNSTDGESGFELKSTIRQIRLYELSDEALDTEMERVAWMYSHGWVNNEILMDLIATNKAKQPYDLDVADVLLIPNAKFKFVYLNGPANAGNATMTHTKWCNSPEKIRKEYDNVLIEFSVPGKEELTKAYESYYDDDEDTALDFAYAFWEMAKVFTSYALDAGSMDYTLDWKKSLDRNKIKITRIGLNDNCPWGVVGLDLSPALFKNIDKADAYRLLMALDEAFGNAKEQVSAAMEMLNKQNSAAADPTTSDSGKSVLDFLIKIMADEPNESTRLKFDERVKDLRDNGMSDAEIVRIFEIGNNLRDQISQATEAWEKEQKEKEEQEKKEQEAASKGSSDSGKSGSGSSKDSKDTKDTKTGSGQPAKDWQTALENIKELKERYGDKADAVNIYDWQLAIPGPEFKELRGEGRAFANLPLRTYTIFELCEIYIRKNKSATLPQFLEMIMASTIARLEGH